MVKSLSHHDIYDAALDDHLFSDLPRRLGQEIDVPSVMFFWLHPGDLQEISAGTQPEANDYYTDFMRDDPWMAAASERAPDTGAFRLSDHVNESSFQQSIMYNDYILRNRLERYWCVGMMQTTRDGNVATAFHKGKKGGDFSDFELGYINGHARDLGRLHSIRRELIRSNVQEIAAADRTLRDEVPLFELDHEGRLLRLNGLAEELLTMHPLVVLQRSRVLALGGAHRFAFKSAIGAATVNADACAGAIDLPPMRGSDGRIFPDLRLNLLPQNNGGRRVLIIATTEDPSGIKSAFATPEETVHLTPRERDILQGLIRGRRREQLAHDLGISVPTVDLHSTNMRRKLGAKTLPEAIAISFRLGLF
jgi:DNA-binding CsgD family transcriptional regulator